MRKITTLAVVLALLGTLPAGAATRTVAPPGNSEADQYYETLPGSTGPRAPSSQKDAEEATQGGGGEAAADGALRLRGATGVAAADAIARTAPSAGERGNGSAGGSPAGVVRPPDEGGLGDLFVPLLAIVAVASAALFVGRRRRRRSAK